MKKKIGYQSVNDEEPGAGWELFWRTGVARDNGSLVKEENSFSPDSRHLEDIPLDGSIKLGEIHAYVDYVAALHLVDVPQVDL